MQKSVQPVHSLHCDQPLELAFATIFRTYEYRLYTLALRLTKSDLFARDIIQDVFVKLWEHRDSMHAIDNMEAWLYRITENRVIDFLRKAAADKRLKERVWNNLPKNTHDTEQVIETNEYHHIVQFAIEQLPPRRRLIYQLNREQGLDYQQIADELSISRHTVKNQLSTAMQSIRRVLLQAARIFF
jgi:RNA polymerase sigma-70 factor, Bacteroides expansion family 1